MKTENKIIAVCSNYAWTIFNFRMPLLRRLKSEGYKVVIFTEFDGYEEYISEVADYVEPLFISRKGTNPFTELLTILDLIRLLKKYKPSAFLPFTIKPVLYGSIASRLTKVPAIVMITGLGTAFISSSWITRVVKLVYKLALISVPVVFFQNKSDSDFFINNNLVDVSKCRHTPGSGIDIDEYNYSEPPETEAKIFLLIARMITDKGVCEFVEASRVIKEKYPKVKFQLLGPLGIQNRTAISKLQMEKWHNEGSVEYLGETVNVRPFIFKSSCVVLPSYREGTPRTLLEAAAMGRPIIATDVPGCREVVDHGYNGLLCRPRDATDLADCIEIMINHDYQVHKDMSIAGRKKIEIEFQHNIVCDMYMDAILEINKN